MLKVLLTLLNLLSAKRYTNEFILKFTNELSSEEIDQIATDNGMINKGKIIGDNWHFINPRLKRRDTIHGSDAKSKLKRTNGVLNVKQLKLLSRVKRDYDHSLRRMHVKTEKPRHFGDEINDFRKKRRSLTFSFDVRNGPNDAFYKDMWYINPDYKIEDNPEILRRDQKAPRMDMRHMNVTGAWALGYSGKGIVVTILDDGVEINHPDLKINYYADASYDINDDDRNPTPSYTGSTENRHGTRCAGQVGASANNGECVPGIAFNAKIGGIRMLDGDVSDVVEAMSVFPSALIQHDREKSMAEIIDVYSASWGPDDDGKTVDGPGELTRQAFVAGTTQGRNGKGSIYIWASGNGGKKHDNCNCDGYTNSIYTISVSSTSEQESIPWYSESCSSTIASTYSSGSSSEKEVLTTDWMGSCTVHHTGTSASAPMAAAIVALTLEANPNLGWRDMQHIVIQTSKRQLLKAEDWEINGVQREFSHRYGYGLMDAGQMVHVAKTWVNVPKLQRNFTKSVIKNGRSEHKYTRSFSNYHKREYDASFEVTEKDMEGNMIDRLEHVIAKLTIRFDRRGACKIYLISPAGTRSMILGPRPLDVSTKGFQSFPFMSVHFWDENPIGKWEIEVISVEAYVKGTVRKFDLILYGTGDDQWLEDAENMLQIENDKLEVHEQTSTESQANYSVPTQSPRSSAALHVLYSLKLLMTIHLHL